MRFSINIIDRISLFALIIAAVILGCWTLLNHINERKVLDKGKLLYTGKTDRLNSVHRDLEYLAELRDHKKELLAAFNKRIPDSPDVGSFLKLIDSCTEKKGLSLISVNPRAGIKEGPYDRIPVQILLKGGFGKIFGFINELENMERLIVIDRLLVNRPIEGKECDAELIANIYSFSGETLSEKT